MDAELQAAIAASLAASTPVSTSASASPPDSKSTAAQPPAAVATKPAAAPAAAAGVMAVTRNKVVIGTFNADAFQCTVNWESAAPQATVTSAAGGDTISAAPAATTTPASRSMCVGGGDPLPIKLFDLLGYLCIPHIGVYGDDYSPTDPIVIITAQSRRVPTAVKPNSPARAGLTINRLQSIIPAAVFDSLQLPTAATATATDKTDSKAVAAMAAAGDLYEAGALGWNIELYVLVCGVPQSGPCQHLLCESQSEINLMYHAWLFQEIKSFNAALTLKTDAQMAVFEARGIESVHLDIKNELDRGMPFVPSTAATKAAATTAASSGAAATNGILGRRAVGVHSQRFSPCNAQISLLPSCGERSFWTVVKHERRIAISFHIIAGTSERETELSRAAASARSIHELCAGFDRIGGTFASTAAQFRSIVSRFDE